MLQLLLTLSQYAQLTSDWLTVVLAAIVLVWQRTA